MSRFVIAFLSLACHFWIQFFGVNAHCCPVHEQSRVAQTPVYARQASERAGLAWRRHGAAKRILQTHYRAVFCPSMSIAPRGL